MALGYQNPFYLKQAQKKQQSLYDGKVLLKKHDPPVVHDSEETLQLAQESRDKIKQMNKEIKPANYTKINHLSGVFVPQTALSHEELYFLNNSKTANVSKSFSIPNEDLSDDTTPSVARKFLNEVKITIVTLQRVVKQRMTIETHNWASSVHQELHKIEAAKFVGDFKSLAKKADASLAKHKALELEIERLLKAVVSQDIMIIVQNESIVDTSYLQTELERTKERFENCIIKKETEYAKLWNDWYKKCDECKYDKISYDKAYNDMQQKIKRLQAQLGDLKGKSKDTLSVSNTRNPLSQKLENENVELEFQVLNYARENSHLKATYKNLFHSIFVSRAQTKTIIASLQHELQSNIYKNAKLRMQLFKKVSDQKDNTQNTSENNKFAKLPIVENLPKIGETNALSKPVTSNSDSTPQESKSVNNDKVIAPGMFRIHPSKTSREEKHVPNTKYQPKVSKPKKVESHKSLATPKPRKSRLLLRWSPTGKLFDKEGKIVDSSESKSRFDCYNGGNLELLINFVWKFMETVRFGNDRVAAILGFGDLQWGNILITRVYFIEGLGHNLFSVGQFCDSDLEVAFRRDACFRYVLVIVDDYSRYTWAHFLRSKDEAPEVIIKFLKRITVLLQSPVIIIRTDNGTEFKNQMLKDYFDTVGISHQKSSVRTPQQNRVVERRNRALVEAARTIALCYPKNDREDIGKLSAKDLLFEAMYNDYIGGQPSATARTIPPAQEPQDIDELNPNAMVDGNTFVNPFANSSTSAAASSSSQNVDPSNMHTFYQPYPHEFQWTKDHPLKQVIGEPSQPVLTWNQLRSDGYMCMYALTVSIMEPKNVKEAMTDPAWIESMQEELFQFKRMDVWALVPAPDNISPLTLKWIFKNKHDEEQTVIRNKSCLVVRGYRQEEGIDFEESGYSWHMLHINRSHYCQSPKFHEPLSTREVNASTINRSIGFDNPVRGYGSILEHPVNGRFVLRLVGQVRVLHVPSQYQYADIFTKGLPSAVLKEFRTNLSVRCPSDQTVGEC
nr:integrase, catalytic region, zinc finger, CCHC-type, peptidase aspartic, catalytic [Tanacetum cinerariifolium]